MKPVKNTVQRTRKPKMHIFSGSPLLDMLHSFPIHPGARATIEWIEDELRPMPTVFRGRRQHESR